MKIVPLSNPKFHEKNFRKDELRKMSIRKKDTNASSSWPE